MRKHISKFLIITLVAYILLLPFGEIKVNAALENGEIQIVLNGDANSNNKNNIAKDKETTYRTVGFVITRCLPGIAFYEETEEFAEELLVPDEFIWITTSDPIVKDRKANGGNLTLNTLDFEALCDRVKAMHFDDWYSNLTNASENDTLMIRTDNLTVISHYGVPGITISGTQLEKNATVTKKGSRDAYLFGPPNFVQYAASIGNITTGAGAAIVNWTSEIEDMHMPGCTGANSPIDLVNKFGPNMYTHHNKYNYIKFKPIEAVQDDAPQSPAPSPNANWGKPAPESPPQNILDPDPNPENPFDPAPTVEQSLGNPSWNFYNRATYYDLSQGIPTAEYFSTGVNVNTWYGTANIARKEVDSGSLYKTDYEIIECCRVWCDGDDDHDGHWITFEINEGTRNYTPKRYGAYYYLNDVDIKDFEQATIYNDLFRNDPRRNIDMLIPGVAPEHPNAACRPDYIDWFNKNSVATDHFLDASLLNWANMTHRSYENKTLNFDISVNDEHMVWTPTSKTGPNGFSNFTPNDDRHVFWYGTDGFKQRAALADVEQGESLSWIKRKITYYRRGTGYDSEKYGKIF